jgi:hypothetical protein
MTEYNHHDTRALDLLKCVHWGAQLSNTVGLFNLTWNAPVIDTDGTGDEYTAVQQLRVFLDAAARDVVERPAVGEPMDPWDLEHDLQTIAAFRKLAERGREAARLAELIADILQAPYNDDDRDEDTAAESSHLPGVNLTILDDTREDLESTFTVARRALADEVRGSGNAAPWRAGQQHVDRLDRLLSAVRGDDTQQADALRDELEPCDHHETHMGVCIACGAVIDGDE